MRFLPLIFPAILFASINEPMRWEFSSGYRNDNFHWHLQGRGKGSPLTYSEHTRDLQYWQNALDVRVIYRDIAVFAKGSCAALGSATLKQRYSSLGFTSAQPQFFFSTDAWAADGWGYFGYSVNLTPDRTYKVVLVPYAGYGANTAHLRRPGTKTASGEGFTMESSLPGTLETTWFGPLVGGFFMIQPGGRLQFEAGYAWHRMHVRLQMKKETDVSGALTLEKLKIKDGGNLAHSGWLRADYLLSHAWRMGLLAEIQYSTSRVLDSFLKNETSGVQIPQKFKVRWTAVSGSLLISRIF